MNRRPSLLAATALTAAAALTLSACGSDDGAQDEAEGATAVTTNETQPSPAATTSTAAADHRPKIELPSDLTYTFDWPRAGDKDKDAVLADSEQSIKAVDLAIVKQDALDKAYLYYYEGEAAAGVKKFVQEYVDAKATITGAYRFYDPEVTLDGDDTASFRYCEDQGQAYVKYLPDKVKRTEVSKDSYVVYHTSLKKNAEGVWVIQRIVSQRGSDKCQP
ncbi:hypothetical protein DI272_29150 [Streptomyces sp. Act143]|uniref:hypothetical protein n=1 Tax=Streptomyces sp. Act143 TaxID=2200760 RepID=UPI000D681A99|nr:hypothetical protein [Streptomyces sp. Act143]PWI17776.1 hypothetical protein DI272_29150 [Streptomyces sp. Act143]